MNSLVRQGIEASLDVRAKNLMHILFLSTWFPHPADNGSKIRVYNLLKALGKKHTVTLLSFAFGTANPEKADILYQHCDRVKVIHHDPHRPNRLLNKARFLSPTPLVTISVPAMSRLVNQTLTEQHFDVIISSTESMVGYATAAQKPIKKILEEHNSSTRRMEERYREQCGILQRTRCWFSWQKTKVHEQRVLPQFDLITMVSAEDRRATLELLPDNSTSVEIVPNGVDCRKNRLTLAGKKPNALVFNGALTYSANYNAMKSFLTLIYPHIKREIPEVSLTITGSTLGVDISGLALDENVEMSGYLEDIRPVVSDASVCVVPIIEGGGTRVKILEAMALGTPVVATSKGAEGLDVINEEHIILADGPDEFARQVVRLLRNPTNIKRMAENARRLVEEQYEWEAIGQQFVELVETAAEKRVAGSEDRPASKVAKN